MILFAVLTAGAIGLPGIWFLHGQLDRRAWEHVDQASRMIQVLLDVRFNELNQLAALTAGRPTLSGLLEEGDPASLAAYLETLRSEAGLDLVVICSRLGEALAQSGAGIPDPDRLCQSDLTARFYQPPPGSGAASWLLASQPIPNQSDLVVVAGQAFDRAYLEQLSGQIGLETLLLADGRLLNRDLAGQELILEAIDGQEPVQVEGLDDPTRQHYELDGGQYYASRSKFGQTGLETIVLLPGAATAEIQQRLTRIAAGGLLLVTIVCSVLGIFLARRVSYPLRRLRNSAITLRKGNLNTPVQTETKIKEIAQVAYALEDARIALQNSMAELRQEKAWGDYLLESVVEGIITIDRKSRITFFSHGAERITDMQQEQVLGKDIDEVFILAEREQRFSQRIPAPGNKPEIVTILVDDRPLTLAVSGAQLTPPEVGKANLAVSIRDISNEEAMRGLLGDFLANITHEFRTPLTALAVSIELLLDQLPDLNQAEIRELLVSNHLGVLSLQNLIDNLLEGASIEAGRFRVYPQPTDMSAVVDEVTRTMLPLMEKNHLNLKLDLPAEMPLVQADPRRTSQVLVNLLSNAIKWSPKGSEIVLSAAVMEQEVKISVVDQGPGIKMENKQNLFTRFSHRQADNGRAEYGAGLGLSVVKAIVESQQGQVGVEDRPGWGAAFWFTVPIVATPPEDGSPDETPPVELPQAEEGRL